MTAAAALGLMGAMNIVGTIATLTAELFGRFSVGVLFGWIFLSHQVGAAAGAWVGGWLFDASGSYAAAFVSAAILAFVAAGLSLLIREGRPAPLAPKEAAAY